MRRFPLALAGLAVVLAACGPQPRQVPTLPTFPDSIPTATQGPTIAGTCRLGFTGSGAEVMGVMPGSASVGILEVGDIIIGLSGNEVVSSSDLVAQLRAFAPGDVTRVKVIRNGEEAELEVTLAEHPTELGRALMGVEVVTQVEMFDPGQLPELSSPLQGRFVRGIVSEGILFLLDPVSGSWQTYMQDGPDDSWAMIGSEIYAIESPDGGGAVLTALGSGEQQAIGLGDWEQSTLVTSLGGLGMTFVRRTLAGNTATESGVVAIDPSSGDLVWEWLPQDVAGSAEDTQALFGYANPAHDRLVVVLASATDASAGAQHAILDANGEELTGWPAQGRFLPSDVLVFGWFDDGSLLFASTAGDGLLFAFDVTSRESVAVDLPIEFGSPSAVWPVGDGRHLIARTDTRLLLLDTVGGETRPLSEGCNISSVGDPGWPPTP